MEKNLKDDNPNDQLETYEASQVKGGGGQVATCHTRPPVQVGDPPHLPRPDREVDRNAHGEDDDKREVEILRKGGRNTPFRRKQRYCYPGHWMC